MAFTSADLAVVEKALKSGVTEVQFRDRTVKYRSMRELIQVRDTILRELGKGKSFDDRGRYVSTKKDLE